MKEEIQKPNQIPLQEPMSESKCGDCFANIGDANIICIAPMCAKEWDFDPETRTYYPINNIKT
jgi:hypothetical protein